MAQTSIEWTATRLDDGTVIRGFTFNCWLGCTNVSEGCARCYAERLSQINPAVLGEWGRGKPRRRTSAAYWRQPLKWDRQARGLGVRLKVFCASMADVFDPEVPPAWRADLWDLIRRCPHLDWLLLTKRPEGFASMLPSAAGGWPWPNVWLGVSVENQRRAAERIPVLLATPAALRFLSCEPLLGPLDLTPWLSTGGIHWVIVGAESGKGARPMDREWAADLLRQAEGLRLAFFYKQEADEKGRKVPLPLLDGRQWAEVPAT
jgi:protein gp37